MAEAMGTQTPPRRNGQPEIISREDAIAKGRRRYFTGEPCVNGHIDLRNVGSNNECIGCKRERDAIYAARTKEQKAAYDRRYREQNVDALRASKAAYKAGREEKFREYSVRYYAENIDRMKAYREANKEKRNAQKREWHAKNRAHVAAYSLAYSVKKMSEDECYKLAAKLRQRLAVAVRNGAKAGSAVRDLGCSIEELKLHLDRQFSPGMTWENWGRKGWHIDHIRPLASFDLTDEAQARAACHYSNLQPLWYRENLSKGARTDWQSAAA
jgi:hypothetical protein